MALAFDIIETRQISGLGTIQVPSGAQPNGARVDFLLFDLIRPATNRYRNFTWFPPKERIANLTFRRSGVVVKHDVVEFARQGFYDYADPGGQALVAIQCSYKGVLQTFVNLGLALLLPPISVQNDIAEYTRLEVPYDEVVVSCYADSAVSVTLYQLRYEVCGADSGLDQALPELPPPPAQTPPGTPITPSDPYDENNPNEPYAPSDVDQQPDPCEGVGLWRVEYNAGGLFFEDRYIAGQPGDTFTVTFDPISGCSTPAQIRVNGSVADPQFACNVAVSNVVFIYIGEVPLPSGGVLLTNEQYPTCGGS